MVCKHIILKYLFHATPKKNRQIFFSSATYFSASPLIIGISLTPLHIEILLLAGCYWLNKLKVYVCHLRRRPYLVKKTKIKFLLRRITIIKRGKTKRLSRYMRRNIFTLIKWIYGVVKMIVNENDMVLHGSLCFE